MTEDWEERQKARRVLEAAVAEAGEKPGEHVFALPVMRRAGVSNVEFRSAARYLDEEGWISEGADDYETFVVTPEGVSRITGQTVGNSRSEDEGSQDDDESTQEEDESTQEEDESAQEEDESAQEEDESSQDEDDGSEDEGEDSQDEEAKDE